ncbi:MAG TPA: hypothetical protein VKX45_00265 [Bryobacteraceae bacterium]|jgi:predicted nuclease with TOPRIM domain|nr:hypothetical protein [Bryobacteraceae bacterium]
MEEKDIAARLERIEHVTAALAEERRKDRDEYKTLWRETQRHIDELAIETRIAIGHLTKQLQQYQEQTEHRFQQYADAGKASEERIARLTGSIGEPIRHLPRPPQ